jgi:hypothetical protein
LVEFRRVEAEEMGAGTHERYLHVAQELAKQYGVAIAPANAPAGPTPCDCGQ